MSKQETQDTLQNGEVRLGRRVKKARSPREEGKEERKGSGYLRSWGLRMFKMGFQKKQARASERGSHVQRSLG
jgi:hypothetical protein